MSTEIKQLNECAAVIPILADWIAEEWWADKQEGIRVVMNLLEKSLNGTGVPTTLVAFDDETVVGTASLIERDFGTEAWPQFAPWVAAVYVSPAYRGRGIGSTIMTEIVQLAARLEVPDLYLWTKNQSNFYQRLGWRIIDRQPPGPGGADLLHMKIEARVS